MDTLLTIVKYITDSLGAMVIMPLFLIVLGLAFRMKPLKAFRSGLLVGIGFQGINLIIGLLGNAVSPAATALAEKVGLNFNIIDVGFPTVGAAAWATPIAALVIPIAILINVIMITLKLTKTLNIDIWNMFHFILAGGIAYLISGSIAVGLVVSAIFSIITLLLADWDSKTWQEYFGLEGTSCSTLATMTSAICSCIVNKIIDLIPGIRDFDINPAKINKLKGIGDPMFLGFFIGIVLSLLGGLPLDKVLNTGVGIAAAMVLLPRMVSLLMEGLAPISRAASDFTKKKLKGRTLLIGMDCALGIGDPTVIAASTIMIPFAVLLAVLLPGNGFLPIVSLTGLTYFCVPAAAYSKGNLFRTIVTMLIFYTLHIYVINAICPLVTGLATWAGVDLPAGASLIAGGNPEHAFLLLIKPILSIFGLAG
ncbi:PTS galactitol transporter subunit IIC [Anaerofustis stercorihominis]|uniref:PTS system Galactitol-specific IIC component n=2 Tax=Anaerofustis stercorihominis TaxID=214853 RepID=B1C8V6_9FIRM|nr:PTS transporter subunit IIC [Anaerofustis stercorihominis]EDS72016.1 PTS system Galactitol-specific IIC component [Anaerofustis stercorihominis DSM 17244]MCQ4795933.1 PTS galactitol transporter subunit IIC [Anaerofustis stercorihominis]RGD74941.1 PTS galactitol transporter subunit IIC [Anaerofustis stercorihominis]